LEGIAEDHAGLQMDVHARNNGHHNDDCYCVCITGYMADQRVLPLFAAGFGIDESLFITACS
jgi:hypothetical protein